MCGLYIDDMKGTYSPITDTICVKYKRKISCCFGLEKSGCYIQYDRVNGAWESFLASFFLVFFFYWKANKIFAEKS